MKTSSGIATFGLMALAAAAPADVVRRQAPTAAYVSSYAVGTGSAGYYPSTFGTASGYYPTGTGAAYPTGTGPAIPIGTGTPCSNNGEVVCSSDGTQFGLCNFGTVSFQPVADGTSCKDGKIDFSDAYAGAHGPPGGFPAGGPPFGGNKGPVGFGPGNGREGGPEFGGRFGDA